MSVKEFAHLFDEYIVFLIRNGSKSLEKISNLHINKSKYKDCTIKSVRHRSTFIYIILDEKEIKDDQQ